MLLVAAFVVLVPVESFACSCLKEPAPKKAMEGAAAVFTGTVTDVVRVAKDGTKTTFDPKRDLDTVAADLKAGKPFPSDQIEVTFRVDRAWKGVEKDTVVVQTGVPVCCICIPEFRVGETWIIYASALPGGALTTSRCSRSTDIAHAAKDLADLGKPAQAFAGVSGTIAPSEIDARHAAILAKLPVAARKAIVGASKGRLVDACSARFTQRSADEWAVTVLSPAGAGGLASNLPRIERWMIPAKGPPIELDWTRAEGFSVTPAAEKYDDRLFYGELQCLSPANRAAFLKGFLDGFERAESKAVDLETAQSACFSFDSTYNNWQCFA